MIACSETVLFAIFGEAVSRTSKVQLISATVLHFEKRAASSRFLAQSLILEWAAEFLISQPICVSQSSPYSLYDVFQEKHARRVTLLSEDHFSVMRGDIFYVTIVFLFKDHLLSLRRRIY